MDPNTMDTQLQCGCCRLLPLLTLCTLSRPVVKNFRADSHDSLPSLGRLAPLSRRTLSPFSFNSRHDYRMKIAFGKSTDKLVNRSPVKPNWPDSGRLTRFIALFHSRGGFRRPVDARTIKSGWSTTVSGLGRSLEPSAASATRAASWPMRSLCWSMLERGTRSESS